MLLLRLRLRLRLQLRLRLLRRRLLLLLSLLLPLGGPIWNRYLCCCGYNCAACVLCGTANCTHCCALDGWLRCR